MALNFIDRPVIEGRGRQAGPSKFADVVVELREIGPTEQYAVFATVPSEDKQMVVSLRSAAAALHRVEPDLDIITRRTNGETLLLARIPGVEFAEDDEDDEDEEDDSEDDEDEEDDSEDDSDDSDE